MCISDSKYETNTLYQTSIHTTSVSPFTQRLSGPLHSMFCAYRHAVANALHMLYIHTHTIAQPSRTHMRIVTLFFVILALTLTAPCDSTCRNREGRLRSRLQSGGKLCLALHPYALRVVRTRAPETNGTRCVSPGTARTRPAHRSSCPSRYYPQECDISISMYFS